MFYGNLKNVSTDLTMQLVHGIFAIPEFLENMNYFRSSVDYGIFTWCDNQNLSGVLLTHVDDFLYAGTTSVIQKVIDPLCKHFEISHQSTTAFKYIGLDIEQNSHGIYLDQIDYIEGIKPIEISRKDRNLNNPNVILLNMINIAKWPVKLVSQTE